MYDPVGLAAGNYWWIGSATETNGSIDYTSPTGTSYRTYYSANVTASGMPDLISTTAGLIANVVAQDAFQKGFVEGLVVGYGNGYDQGYDDGYNDGFRDGFIAGVASVTVN